MSLEGYAGLVLLVEHVVVILLVEGVFDLLFLNLVVGGILSFNDGGGLVLILEEVVLNNVVGLTLAAWVLEKGFVRDWILALLRSLAMLLDGHEVLDLVLHVIFVLLLFDLLLFGGLEDILDQLGLSLWENTLVVLKVEHFDRLFRSLLGLVVLLLRLLTDHFLLC